MTPTLHYRHSPHKICKIGYNQKYEVITRGLVSRRISSEVFNSQCLKKVKEVRLCEDFTSSKSYKLKLFVLKIRIFTLFHLSLNVHN